MEKRNLDLGIDVTREQWEELGRTAAELGPAAGGYDWREEEPHRIDVFFRGDDVPEGWSDFVSPGGRYGAHERRIAELRFNDGRPYAHIEPPDHFVERPTVSRERQRTMLRALERWVRGRWHDLMRASGLHYERGHIPQG